VANPISPKVVKGALIIYENQPSPIPNVIRFQFNPENLTRTLTPQSIGDTGDAAEVYRLSGPPSETIKIKVEIDIVDYLEKPEENTQIIKDGLYPQLAAFETILYPSSTNIQQSVAALSLGSLEIHPPEGPYVVFVWGEKRVIPVRLTNYSVTEDAFDTNLNPIRATVTLDLKVLSYSDFDPSHKGFNLFLLHHKQKESFAKKATVQSLSVIGPAGKNL